MRPETVFIKTQRGQEELDSRSLGLGVTTRRLLIQIDGQRSVARLTEDNARWMDVAAALDELASHGLIAEPGQAPSPVLAAAANSGGSMRDTLIAVAVALLDEKHTARITSKLESLPEGDAEALGEGVKDCVRLIRLTIDEDKADEFSRQAARVLHAGD